MSAEADEPGAIAVPDRRLDRPRVQAAVCSIEDQTTVNREIRYGSVHDPGDPVRHLEDIHEHDGLHTGVPSFYGRLDRVQPSRTAGQVRCGVNVDVYGPFQKLLGQFKGTVLGQ